jgi:CubicO group peptidase (beta-lactamase class C family)
MIRLGWLYLTVSLLAVNGDNAQIIDPAAKTMIRGAALAAADDSGSVRALIARTMSAESVPSFAVAAVRHGRIVWEEGFGATPQTPFSLASVTKALRGTALTMLVDRGRVDLDRPVNAYLGRAKVHSTFWKADDATVRRVAYGWIDVVDAPFPYDLQLGLELQRDELVGFATTQARPGVPGPALSFWVELHKEL